MKTSIAMFLVLILSSTFVFSQEALQEKLNQDGVKVTYEWKPSDKKIADSQLQLCLVIDNTNEHSVKMEFIVEFYLKGEIYEESLAQNSASSPESKLRGKNTAYVGFLKRYLMKK